MRIDMTAEREKQVMSWAKTVAYTKLSSKVLAMLQALKDNGEMQRTDLFRAAGYKANAVSYYGFGYTIFTDFRMFATELVTMRATGIAGRYGWNGVRTYWTITQKGLDALK